MGLEYSVLKVDSKIDENRCEQTLILSVQVVSVYSNYYIEPTTN